MPRPPENEWKSIGVTAAPAVPALRAPALDDTRLHALGLTAAWAAWVALIDPRGELALNDDWAYVLPVQMLFERGALQLTFFQGMTLVGQLAWGALFCVPFGFSLTALRLSTLVLGVLSYLAFRARERRQPRPTAEPPRKVFFVRLGLPEAAHSGSSEA